MMNISYFFITLFNIILLAGWIVLAVLALVQLRRLNLNETTRAIWAALVVVVPILGAIAFWIVRPGQESA
jgi:membrane protease YdiL (CAAX protease family)